MKVCEKHPNAERYKSGQCIACTAEYNRNYWKANSEKINETNKAWAKNNRKRSREIKRRWNDANPEKRRMGTERARLKREYGITPEQVEEMIQAQGNACAVCRTPFAKTGKYRPNIDHCHKTGRVRGVLCLGCNAGIGSFRDSPIRLLRAALWLLGMREKLALDESTTSWVSDNGHE